MVQFTPGHDGSPVEKGSEERVFKLKDQYLYQNMLFY